MTEVAVVAAGKGVGWLNQAREASPWGSQTEIISVGEAAFLTTVSQLIFENVLLSA